MGRRRRDLIARHRTTGPLTLKQLRYFLAVLRAGSFTAAARTLLVAQPAIGVQVGALEDELGVRLLTRHSRGVAPTEAGERLARESARLVAEAGRMRRGIMEMGREPHGRIALGLTGTAVPVFYAALMQACGRKYPDLDLTVTEAASHRLADWLARGRIDMAVTGGPGADSGAGPEALAAEALHFVAPAGHALAAGPDIPLRAALRADLVLPPKPSMVRRLIQDAAHSNGAALGPVREVDSVTGMKELVRHGAACAVMPYGAVRREVEAGYLAAPPIVEPRLARPLYLTCSESRAGARALEAVRGEIRALAAELLTSRATGWTAPAMTGP